jgi:hypothetical protein
MRIRSVKPEFWTSEKVGKLSRDARLVFIGLFNLADDEGRFRAAPSMVAGALLPYDEDGQRVVKKALDELAAKRLVRLYSHDDCSYGWVIGFSEHQAIDRPKASKLPAPTLDDESTIDRRRIDDASLLEGNRDQGRDQGTGSAERPVVDGLRDVWNANRPTECPEWKTTGKARESAAKARLREEPNIEAWVDVIRRLKDSDFARGKNDRGWVADPDWLLKPDTRHRILEGKYANRTGPPRDVTRGMAGDKQTYSETPGIVEAP